MAFPGTRTRKRHTPVKASVITGVPNFDCVFVMTEADFDDADKTLGGPLAMAQGATDFGMSIGADGSVRLACDVVRCDLSATPADSKIEIWCRVIGVNDVTDVPVYRWWGDATATLPLASEPYGSQDVWNGTTGDGAPPIHWAAYAFDEDPAGPSPQYTDRSGHGRHIANTTGATRVDYRPGRAVSTPSELFFSANNTPGTADFAAVWFGIHTGGSGSLYYWSDSSGQQRYVESHGTSIDTTLKSSSFTLSSNSSLPTFHAMSRDGDVAAVATNVANGTISGLASMNYTSAGWNRVNYEAANISFISLLDCAPNIHWIVALRTNLLGTTSVWDLTHPSEPAQITAYLTVSPIAIGTEVRIYEQPHAQSWEADFSGLTASTLGGKSFTFYVKGSETSDAHYAYFVYDGTGTDPVLEGTGHAVAIAVGDDDEDIAAAVQAVLDAITGLSATADVTSVTVTNDLFGEMDSPADVDTDAAIDLTQAGGLLSAEIDGVEESSGRSWTGQYSILRPRLATVVIAKPGYEVVRIESFRLTTTSSEIPSGQRVDLNYLNP